MTILRPKSQAENMQLCAWQHGFNADVIDFYRIRISTMVQDLRTGKRTEVFHVVANPFQMWGFMKRWGYGELV